MNEQKDHLTVERLSGPMRIPHGTAQSEGYQAPGAKKLRNDSFTTDSTGVSYQHLNPRQPMGRREGTLASNSNSPVFFKLAMDDQDMIRKDTSTQSQKKKKEKAKFSFVKGGGSAQANKEHRASPNTDANHGQDPRSEVITSKLNHQAHSYVADTNSGSPSIFEQFLGNAKSKITTLIQAMDSPEEKKEQADSVEVTKFQYKHTANFQDLADTAASSKQEISESVTAQLAPDSLSPQAMVPGTSSNIKSKYMKNIQAIKFQQSDKDDSLVMSKHKDGKGNLTAMQSPTSKTNFGGLASLLGESKPRRGTLKTTNRAINGSTNQEPEDDFSNRVTHLQVPLMPPKMKSGSTSASREEFKDGDISSRRKSNGDNKAVQKIYMTTEEALKKYDDVLTMFEKTELNRFKEIYTVGAIRREGFQELADYDGFYIPLLGEQIGYRYQITDLLDKGAFGQVVKCLDMAEHGRAVALKISRNTRSDIDNARQEVKILLTLKEKDPHNRQGIVQFTNSFAFRKHVVLVFELLGNNMYREIRQDSFKGIQKDSLRLLVAQIAKSLRFIKKSGIIHCDLKPENIIYTDEKKDQVKVIDFGSSCFNYKNGFSYVQSRFYRSPEILLGLPYTAAVDMWSFGCIIAELSTGKPLFPAIDENELLELMVMTVGRPTQQMINRAKKRGKFFDREGTLKRSPKSRVAHIDHASYNLKKAIYCDDDDEFVEFIARCLDIDPETRMTPDDALKHPWLRRKNTRKVLKENEMIVQSVINDMNFASIIRENSKRSSPQNPDVRESTITKPPENVRPSNNLEKQRQEPQSIPKQMAK